MYSYKFDKFDDNNSITGKVGRARLEGIDASFKDLIEVCANINGLKTLDAILFLDSTVVGDTPIFYRKYTSKLAHRKELRGRQGRYPKKAAKFVLATLKSAIASAMNKGLGEDLIIIHAAANKKNVFPRVSPNSGRIRRRSYYETARVEIIVTPCDEIKLNK
ncbi:MAG: 50S ribosomal protein L22 [Candidatus Micrarchaeota archaeon]